MLRNVLEDYLSSVRERDFYYPLSSLLQVMGFFDIIITDGTGEFGKDFIAKRIEDGVKYQYKIQAKRDDIDQEDFRKVMGQLLEAIILKKLSHPQLDTSLPQKTILVTTGELTSNAFIAHQEFNEVLVNEYKKEKVEFWGKSKLIEYSELYGLTGIHQTTAKGLKGYGQFYQNYSRAIDKLLTDREIEEYSRFWLDEYLDYKKRILRAAIEAEIIASKLIEGGRVYEAIFTNLSLARVVMEATYDNDDPFIFVILKELVEEIITPLCKEFFTEFKSDWEGANKSLTQICFRDGFFPIFNYLVWCARVLEITALYYFISTDKKEKDKVISFLTEFIEKEEGCGHIPADRYSSTIVWPTLAFIKSGKIDEAKNLVRRSTVWLCDKVEKGFGIAHWDAEEQEETAMLLFYPFDFIRVEPHKSYFLTTILVDLAAFIGDTKFYNDVTNDLDACEIAYFYWQFPDTKAIFTIDTEECRKYSGMDFYADEIREDHAEYLKEEPDSFRITEKAGFNSLVILSTLLKDRYFVKTWKQFVHPTEES
jgi:restriction endonuclease